MSLPITIHPDAQAEFDEAYDWFESHWPDSGDKFAESIREVCRRIAANPRMHGVIKTGVRRATVPRFRYYVIYYRERTHDVEVLSVFHTSRDPSVWQDRI